MGYRYPPIAAPILLPPRRGIVITAYDSSYAKCFHIVLSVRYVATQVQPTVTSGLSCITTAGRQD